LLALYPEQMKFKTLTELNEYIEQKRNTSYQTELSVEVSLDEIYILREKPENISYRTVQLINEKIEERVTSIVKLLSEIEGIKYSGCRMLLNGKDIRHENGKVYIYTPNKKASSGYFKNHAELLVNCSDCGIQEIFYGKNRREVATKLFKSGWRKDDTYKNMTVHHCGDCC
jgi:hypothetical protein